MKSRLEDVLCSLVSFSSNRKNRHIENSSCNEITHSVDTNTTSATTAAQSGASSALQHQPHPYQSTVDRLIGTHSHNAAALEGSATPFYREPPALDPKMLQPLHHPQVSIVADATDYQNPATALDDVYRGWGHMG